MILDPSISVPFGSVAAPCKEARMLLRIPVGGNCGQLQCRVLWPGNHTWTNGM
jgi:hypothetical protein